MRVLVAIWTYLHDWTCQYKRMTFDAFGSFGLGTYDLLVFIHFESIVDKYGKTVAFVSAILGGILTVIKIAQSIIVFHRLLKEKKP